MIYELLIRGATGRCGWYCASRRLTNRGASTLTTLAEVVTVLGFLLTLYQIGVETGVIEGRGPVQVVQDAIDAPSVTAGSAQSGESVVVPVLPSGPELSAPENLVLSGSCDRYVLTWESVANAEVYRIEEDGHFAGTTTETEYQIRVFPDEKEHIYRVRATALLSDDSPPSNEVSAGPCSL